MRKPEEQLGRIKLQGMRCQHYVGHPNAPNNWGLSLNRRKVSSRKTAEGHEYTHKIHVKVNVRKQMDKFTNDKKSKWKSSNIMFVHQV